MVCLRRNARHENRQSQCGYNKTFHLLTLFSMGVSSSLRLRDYYLCGRQRQVLWPLQKRSQTCSNKDMNNWYDRVVEYHSECRPSFILFTELIAFMGTMATVVGMAILLSLL